MTDIDRLAVGVIGQNIVIDCGTHEDALRLVANVTLAATPAPLRDTLANRLPEFAGSEPRDLATPAPLDVDRLARALFVICAACEPGEEYTDNHHRRHAEAIAAAYAEDPS